MACDLLAVVSTCTALCGNRNALREPTLLLSKVDADCIRHVQDEICSISWRQAYSPPSNKVMIIASRTESCLN